MHNEIEIVLCSNCKNKIDNNNVFCSYCGNIITQKNMMKSDSDKKYINNKVADEQKNDISFKENKEVYSEKNGNGFSIISLVLFLIILIIGINIGVGMFNCTGDDSACNGWGFVAGFYLFFSFVPLFLSFCLGIISLKRNKGNYINKSLLWKILHILNIVSLVIMSIYFLFCFLIFIVPIMMFWC